jgi:hypothetical protein
MSEPTWYIQQQGERESQEAEEVDHDQTMREAEDAEEDEEEVYDQDYEDRKKILNEVMERHPDMAFTGDSVNRFLNEDGDLESAYEDRFVDPYFDSEY